MFLLRTTIKFPIIINYYLFLYHTTLLFKLFLILSSMKSKQATQNQLVEFDNMICRDNVFLFQALELKASTIQQSLYNIMNIPQNINPIKSIMKQIDQVAFKLRPVYKQLQLERVYNFWKKIIKTMGGLNIQLIRILQTKKEATQNSVVKGMNTSHAKTSSFLAEKDEIMNENNLVLERQLEEKIQPKLRKLRGVSLFSQNYVRGIQKIQKKEESIKKQKSSEDIDYETLRKKVFQNVLTQFTSIDHRTFNHEIDEVHIYMDNLQKKIQTFNHTSNVEVIQQILDFFKSTHHQTVQFLKNTTLSGDVSKFQFKLQKILISLKQLKQSVNEKAGEQFAMILTGLKNKEASINNLVSDQAKMIEQHLLKTRKNLVDKCVDTNFKQLKKIKQLEKVTEQKRQYFEQSYKNSQKNFSKLVEEMEVERTKIKKQNLILKLQVQKLEEKKKESLQVSQELMKKINNLTNIKKIHEPKKKQKDVQVNLIQSSKNIHMMNKEKRSSRNSVIELDKTNKEPKRRHSSYLGKQIQNNLHDRINSDLSSSCLTKRKESSHFQSESERNASKKNSVSSVNSLQKIKIHQTERQEKQEKKYSKINTETIKQASKKQLLPRQRKVSIEKKSWSLLSVNKKKIKMIVNQYSITIKGNVHFHQNYQDQKRNFIERRREVMLPELKDSRIKSQKKQFLKQTLQKRRRTKTTIKELSSHSKFKKIQVKSDLEKAQKQSLQTIFDNQINETSKNIGNKMQYFSHMPQNNRENLISKYYRKNASIKESNIKTSKKIINNLQERVHRKNDKLFQILGSELSRHKKNKENIWTESFEKSESQINLKRKKKYVSFEKRNYDERLWNNNKYQEFSDFKKKKRKGDIGALPKASFSSLYHKNVKRNSIDISLFPTIEKKHIYQRE